ncbi:MAG TPA: type III PLP-dependent enzyme [Candidatus Lokiarchaeia archaeon]|nr:type III PLP-dependent enzyme [Candidatus Lokiarchaeia archaeon]
MDPRESLASEHGTPLIIIDHAKIRDNWETFRAQFPRIQPFYSIKANPEPEIVRTLFDLGANFDVASGPEFQLLLNVIGNDPDLGDFLSNHVIMANTIKSVETLELVDPYNLLMTYDNPEELKKIAEHCPHARLVLRIVVPNKRSIVELSSKFGAMPKNAPNLIQEALDIGLPVEGLSYHVGSQCNNLENFTRAASLAANIFNRVEAKNLNCELKVLDIGGGYPAPYDANSLPVTTLATALNPLLDKLFPPSVKIIAEPGRYMVATAATSVSKIIGKAVRKGLMFYYIDDGVYNTFSGKIYDHQTFTFHAFRDGSNLPSAVVGPTCDALDKISLNESLPDLSVGERLYSENVGAYTNCSASTFNGFPLAKIVHINQ